MSKIDGIPKNDRFIVKDPINMDELGVPSFMEVMPKTRKIPCSLWIQPYLLSKYNWGVKSLPRKKYLDTKGLRLRWHAFTLGCKGLKAAVLQRHLNIIEDFQTPIGRKDIVTIGRAWLHAGILGNSGIADALCPGLRPRSRLS